MKNPAFREMLALSSTDSAIEETVKYLTEQLSHIVQEQENVLVCFPRNGQRSLGCLLERAITDAGGVPVFWEGSYRWKDLLRLAFVTRASTIIGTPLTVLGLSKLAAYRGVPLFLFNVITAGYPCLEWMMDGLVHGLDCQLWGLLSLNLSCVVAGFSCTSGRGVHIRDDLFGAYVSDENGAALPDGSRGLIEVYPKVKPEIHIPLNAYGSISTEPCGCGNPAVKLVNLDYGTDEKGYIYQLFEQMHYWNSVLDCWISKTEYGLELEVVCFPGLKLPKFPSCAKLLVRPWDPDTDIPFEMQHFWVKST